ncbi:hypothetical protein Celaphus_00016375 [Cervus elaphus hippelaphus]|uniref:DUF3350 domain-containing protein n=1 Tax=Cervus elaphus hippelaphus TaxID=46360 RepID=A0A212CEP4_CEREH|nr:hypothetical protein Celaphus_00016375 [Cervus elaphus hippelaphus]
MLFTIGQSEVYLISPDTKNIAVLDMWTTLVSSAGSLKEVEAFISSVFQRTNEALVDEIGLHKLCEQIKGINSSKTKLELQKHLTTLTNQEQATIFEEVQKLRSRNEKCLHEEKPKVHAHIGEIKQTSQIAAEYTGSELPSSATRFRLDMLRNKVKRSLTEPLESILSHDNKARGLQEHSASLGLDTSINTSKELSGCEKEALPISKSCFRFLSSLDDLSSDLESQPTKQPALLSPKQGFQRHANTLSHVPGECQASAASMGVPGGLAKEACKDFESKANHVGDASRTPIKMRRHSWRQQIFLRVATPQKACDSPSRYEDYSELGDLSPRSPLEPVCKDEPFSPVPEEKKRTSLELRDLWQKAILQQILVLRMDKENQKLQASENDLLNTCLNLIMKKSLLVLKK